MQWGAHGLSAADTIDAIFPMSFSNTDYRIFALGVINASDTGSFIRGQLNNYKYISHCLLRTSTATGPACQWFVIGY